MSDDLTRSVGMTFADPSAAYNFTIGDAVVWEERMPWHVRFRRRLANIRAALRGWRYHEESVVTSVDTTEGTIGLGALHVLEVWSWRRWQWERA